MLINQHYKLININMMINLTWWFQQEKQTGLGDWSSGVRDGLGMCVCVCVCVCNTEQAACGIPDFLPGHQEDCMQDAN